MPYTIKSQQIAVKDPDTGEYVSVDLLTEQTTEGLLNEIKTLGNQKKNEIIELGDGKKQAITDEATSQLTAITQLGDGKKQAITDEGAAQVSAVNAKGREVLESIPNDYTALAKTVESMAYGGFIYDTASGSAASFDNGADGMLIKSLVVNINPVQSGSGTPSPTNFRQINGAYEVNISHSGTDTSNPETMTVNWQSEAGIVYGGTIDVINGKMQIKYKKYTFDGVGAVSDGLSFAKGSSSSVLMYYSLSSNNSPLIATQATNVYVNGLKCSHFPFGTTTIPNSAFVVQGQLRVALPLDDSRNTAALFNAWVKEQYDNGTPLEIVAELSQPIEVQLTPQEVECFSGVNNIWADTGDVTVTYPVDTKTYIDKKIQEAIDGLSGS